MKKRIIFNSVFLAMMTIFLQVPYASAVYAGDTEDKAADRSATGGAQTLQDILRRQQELKVDDRFRRDATGNPEQAAPIEAPLGARGGVSDSDIFRSLRYDKADVNVSTRDPVSKILIQSEGIAWLEFRRGNLLGYGSYLLAAVLVLLALFYALRGKIRLDGRLSGILIRRFTLLERFGHWLMASAFIILAVSGIITLAGRFALIPLIGKEGFAVIAAASKWLHNYVAFAFMLGLVLVILFWIKDNIPARHDWKWLAKGGGLFTSGVHPPAKKFNAGQKLIFWMVVLFGLSISLSGLALLMPFEFSLFSKTFALLNALHIPQILGLGELDTALTPYAEMHYSHLWHSIVAFVFIAIIIAHIYIGSVGMEGAFDAMSSGEVDLQWAKEHHSLWAEEEEARLKNKS